MFHKKYVVCAAIHIEDDYHYILQPENIKQGFVICGRRHSHCMELLRRLYSDEQIKQFKNKEKITYGFLTSDDQFENRVQAMLTAVNSGQVSELPYQNAGLTSEDLYK